MKATITRVANGYSADYDGRTYVGMSAADIMRILINKTSEEVANATENEGSQCMVEIKVDTSVLSK